MKEREAIKNLLHGRCAVLIAEEGDSDTEKEDELILIIYANALKKIASYDMMDRKLSFTSADFIEKDMTDDLSENEAEAVSNL